MARARRPYREVPAEELARVAGTEHHGGLVAVAIGREITLLAPGAEAPELFTAPVLPVLDGVGNPHNLGAVARSAAFFGCSALVLSGDPRQAGLSDAAWRISEGGLEHLALFRAPDLPAVLRSLAPRLASVAAVPRGGVAPEAIPRDRPIVLLMGNEEVGLSAPMIDACAHRVTLPGSGRVESLNVSAASAVLIHALSQGRGIPGGGASAHVGSGPTGPR
jgi:TrmH RNA methyltransferase